MNMVVFEKDTKLKILGIRAKNTIKNKCAKTENFRKCDPTQYLISSLNLYTLYQVQINLNFY